MWYAEIIDAKTAVLHYRPGRIARWLGYKARRCPIILLGDAWYFKYTTRKIDKWMMNLLEYLPEESETRAALLAAAAEVEGE